MSIRSRLGRLVTIPVSALLLAGVVVGCGGDGGDGLPDPPASPGPQVDDQPAALDLTPEEQEAVEGAQAAFDEFMTAYQDILTAGEPATEAVLSRILPLLGGRLGSEFNSEIFDNYQAGHRAAGRIDWSLVEVAEVDMERTGMVAGQERDVPSVWLRYCVDSTDWLTVDKETDQPVSEPGSRHQVTIEAQYFDSSPIAVSEEELDPVWQVAFWEDEEDEPC